MKVILFATLLLFSINGFAFNWKKVGENTDGDTFYVDVSNIKKHNGLVYYWELGNYSTRTDFIHSYISKYQVTCGIEERLEFLTTYYGDPMGKGIVIVETNDKKIRHPKPNTVSYVLMKFACDNAK